MAKLKITSDGTLSGTVVSEVTTGTPIDNIKVVKLSRDVMDPDVIVALLKLRRPAIEINDIEFAEIDE